MICVENTFVILIKFFGDYQVRILVESCLAVALRVLAYEVAHILASPWIVLLTFSNNS